MKINGLFIIEPTVFEDERGYFMETYHKEEFHSAGLTMEFVQDNESYSTKGVLRGLHFQKRFPQGKLIRVTKGEAFDVAVDIREGSATYGQWEGVLLSSKNKKMFYVPECFAHGFLVISDEVQFVYKCTNFYHPEDEGGIIWNDPAVGVEWPQVQAGKFCISEKDGKLPILGKLKG